VNDSIIELILIIFVLRGLKIYLRTNMKGELVRTIGILIFLIFYGVHNYQGEIAGFIIYCIGWLILYTFENDMRNTLYRQTNILDRLTGNMPKKSENVILMPMKYNKAIGILTGLICLLIALTKYRRLTVVGAIDIIFIGFLTMAGILFIFYNLFKKK